MSRLNFVFHALMVGTLAALGCSLGGDETLESFNPAETSSAGVTSDADESGSGVTGTDDAGETGDTGDTSDTGTTDTGTTDTGTTDTTTDDGTTDTTTDDGTTDTTTGSGCGDGMIEGSEECDGNDLAGLGCEDFDASNGSPFDTGTLGCTGSCTHDTSGCSLCGDGAITGSETCDGTQVGGGSCTGEGFDGGDIACNSTCDGYDTSGCTECGNGTVDPGEDCDGSTSSTCAAEGFDGGTLSCGADCALDVSQCFACGDGIVSGPEVCDCGPDTCSASELANTTCGDLMAPMNGNFTGGDLGCASDCSAFDDAACTWCGDGTKNGAELCDGTDLDGATCVDAGWLPGGGGTVSCAADCSLDDALCTGTQCGGSVPAPPDGAGTCDAGWTDTGSACQQACVWTGSSTCPNPLNCPAGRNCEMDCTDFMVCQGYTLNCAAGQSCDLTCTNTSGCKNATLNCPPDAPCNVTCDNFESCQGLTVVCPAGNHECNVTCGVGTTNCEDLTMQCGGGPCSLTCGNEFQSCEGAQQTCGDSTCTATCNGASTPTQTCGPSCNCQGC